MPDKTPLELAQEIIAGGNGQGHTYFDLFRNAKAVSLALVERMTPVIITAQDERCSCSAHCDFRTNFCPNCGKLLVWK